MTVTAAPAEQRAQSQPLADTSRMIECVRRWERVGAIDRGRVWFAWQCPYCPEHGYRKARLVTALRGLARHLDQQHRPEVGTS